MQNPFRAATDKFFAGPELDVDTPTMVALKASHQGRLDRAAKQRQERADDRIEAEQDDLWKRGRVLMPEGNGNRAGRRAAERRQKRETKAGQAAYRATQVRRRRNRFTAGNMARAAAGEIGTPAMQANVRRALERTKGEL